MQNEPQGLLVKLSHIDRIKNKNKSSSFSIHFFFFKKIIIIIFVQKANEFRYLFSINRQNFSKIHAIKWYDLTGDPCMRMQKKRAIFSG